MSAPSHPTAEDMHDHRNFWVWLHRWTGLVMAGFLIVVAATGSLLAFLPELNHLLAPQIYPVRARGRSCRWRNWRSAEAAAARCARDASLAHPAGTARVTMAPRPLPLVPDFSAFYADPLTGDEYVPGVRPERRPLGFDHLYLDPVPRRARTAGEGAGDHHRPGVMPFIDRLPYRLALGEWGGWILGVVAVIWTLDCLNGSI